MTDYMVYYKDRDGDVRGPPSAINTSSEEEAVARFKEEVQPSEQGLTVDLHVFEGHDEPSQKQAPPPLRVSVGKAFTYSIGWILFPSVLPSLIGRVMLALMCRALKAIFIGSGPPKGKMLSQPAGMRSSQQVVYRGVRRLRRMLQLRRMPWAARNAPVAP